MEEASPDDLFDGDYVTISDEGSPGIVYQIDSISKGSTEYHLNPVFGTFGVADNRGGRYSPRARMKKVDVVRIGLEHMKFTQFILTLSKHYGAQ